MKNEIEIILKSAEDCLLNVEYNLQGGWDNSLDESLRNVFDLRQSCDYDFEFEPDDGSAEDAIKRAREFFKATKAFLSNT
ncbi:MAG: hypothetical protein ABMA02_07315 [Saprospiraceae bacterium]